jgi:hypothetical protein
MKTLRLLLCIAGLLAALPASAKPKHILISDSLLATADQWTVKRNDKWVGMNHWEFGEFKLVAAKQGWTHGGAHTNLFKTKSESYSEQKFSFVMRSKAGDSAFVDAVHQTSRQSNPGLKIGKDTHVGGTGQTVDTDRFIATITAHGDTTETWDLVVGETEVTEWSHDREDLARHSAVLLHGDRRIDLVPVFSRKLDQKPTFGSMLAIGLQPPAMGYEFIEEGRSHCAVEYFSSGMSSQYKNTVWMDRNADPRFRLMLAAAMTAVLELKTQEFPYDPDDPNSPKH